MNYDIEEFIEKRNIEKKWLTSNGYENGNPETNGEYRLLHHFGNWCDLFIDIGANIGDFSKKVLALYGEINIIMFEANQNLFKELCKIDNIKKDNIFNIALSDKFGTIEFNLNTLDHTTSSIFDRTYMMPDFICNTEKVKVQTNTLDSYLDKIHTNSKKGMFIKIDTEGAELSIMNGSQSIFDLKIPIFIQFEYGHGWKEADAKLKDAMHLLNNKNFKIYRITPYGLELIKFYTIDMDNYMYCNYVAIKNIDIDKVFAKKIELLNKTSTTILYLFN